MIYFEIKEKNNDIVASNIRKCQHFHLFEKNRNLTLRNKNLKSAFNEYDSVSLWLIVDNEQELLNSNKLFNKTMKIYANLACDFFDYYFSKIKVHSHTLRTIQGKMKQKVDGLANKKDFLGKDYSESKNKIARKIETNIDKSADIFCYLNKRIGEIDAHIEGFDVLYLGDDLKVDLRNVDIKKVLLSIFAPFLSDFSKKGIVVNFNISDEYANSNKINVGYKFFNLALCNFFDNAIKYSKPYEPININFIKKDIDSFELEISMMSLKIDQDEIVLIFDEGYSGRHASHNAGDGIGMSVMKKALNLTKMSIEINPNYNESETINNNEYIKNVFKIKSI